MHDLDPTLEGRLALIVDDDPVVRVLAQQALAAVGFQVLEAEDGESGLAAVERHRPDVIVLDVEMPGRDGFETCAALRSREGSREIPILVATGHTDAHVIDRAFEVGATDFIKKPLDWQLLQHRVRFMMRATDAFSGLRRTLSHLSASEARLASAQRLARIGNWEWVIDEAEMIWSAELYRILGLEPRPKVATFERFLQALHPDDREGVQKMLLASAHEGREWSLDHRIVCPDGTERFVHQQTEIVRGGDARVERVSGTVQDLTERKRAEEQIRFLGRYDALTALPNRNTLLDHLARTIPRTLARRDKLALLHLDLDRFKRVNESLGHEGGDELLRGVAGRLLNCVRTTDYVGRAAVSGPLLSRLGGDEFTIVLKGVESVDDVSYAAGRVLEALRTPFEINGHRFVVTGSIGIALCPGDARAADRLLGCAHAAMQHAKERGSDAYQFFSESMNEKAQRRLRLEGLLRSALEGEELTLHYQPQFETRSTRMTGAEALIRWNHAEHGMISPAEFIPIAEESDLILPLGEYVLTRACAQVRKWAESGFAPVRVAVNVSSRQVQRSDLAGLVERTLREQRVPADLLELELTESALLLDEPGVVETLGRIRSLGVSLALDDFGTGFSSLSHLVRFPIDVVKIDRSFVQDIGTPGQGSAIVAAVVAMAHRLGLRVVAEGVETADQETFLRSEGCDQLQGFRFARPVDAEAFATLLQGQGRG